jgi:hypothetical protein
MIKDAKQLGDTLKILSSMNRDIPQTSSTCRLAVGYMANVLMLNDITNLKKLNIDNVQLLH